LASVCRQPKANSHFRQLEYRIDVISYLTLSLKRYINDLYWVMPIIDILGAVGIAHSMVH
jgi:hypothetical protein